MTIVCPTHVDLKSHDLILGHNSPEPCRIVHITSDIKTFSLNSKLAFMFAALAVSQLVFGRDTVVNTSQLWLGSIQGAPPA